MRREYILITILLLLSSCVPDNIKFRTDRQTHIAGILDSQVKDGTTNWEYELQADSTREVRHDSIAVRLAIDLANKYSSFHKIETSMEELFPEGVTNTTVGKLNEKQLELYKLMASLLPQIAELRAELRHRIEDFKPSYAPVIKVKTRVPGTFHYFFFNGKNELVSHLQHEDSYAFNLDEIFAEFKGDENAHSFYASTFANSVNNLDSIRDYDNLIEKSTPVHVVRYVFNSEETNAYSTTDKKESSPFPSGANLYEVTKQTYVTSTKDGYDRLIELANANDLSGIDLMVVNGEIGILNPGDKVMMLDIGLAVSKVKNKHGKVIFVDTGSIHKIY